MVCLLVFSDTFKTCRLLYIVPTANDNGDATNKLHSDIKHTTTVNTSYQPGLCEMTCSTLESISFERSYYKSLSFLFIKRDPNRSMRQSAKYSSAHILITRTVLMLLVITSLATGVLISIYLYNMLYSVSNAITT